MLCFYIGQAYCIAAIITVSDVYKFTGMLYMVTNALDQAYDIFKASEESIPTLLRAYINACAMSGYMTSIQSHT